MRLTSVLGAFLLLRLACSLPSPPTKKDVPTLQVREALIEDEQLEGISHLETRTISDYFCLRSTRVGSSSNPPVPLDTEISWQLRTESDTPFDRAPPFRFENIIGTNTVTFLAIRRPIAASARFMGVLFLRNTGNSPRHVSVLRNPPPGQAGPLDVCIATYEVPPQSESRAHEFEWSPSATYTLRLND
ncbi:hypothetical protein EJ03DRAFT_372434 [Teratosphaeria nubilosa]|uniref:Galactose-binding like protein n=1 Tax=Teratosphaeria nubilosa TaxID=161662 RepID=A0A6G1LH13_9PEZI|nr:hypothetical protein EJ03DRAFT_372434 [Teratosphaeria nubilosa]